MTDAVKAPWTVWEAAQAKVERNVKMAGRCIGALLTRTEPGNG